MKKMLTVLSVFLPTIVLFSQVDKSLGNLLADGYTIAELENIYNEVTYKNHSKWMKKKNYIYDSKNSQSNYFLYRKNNVVSFTLFHKNEEITEVASHSSPQKYYQALSILKEDKSYRLVKEVLKDYDGKKMVQFYYFVKGGRIYAAMDDNFMIYIFKDNRNYSSLPTIRSFDDMNEVEIAINEVQDKLKSIGSVYPQVGSLYTGNEKVTQSVTTLDNAGMIQVEKTRVPKNNYCSSASSFHVHEKIKLNLKDVHYVSIYTYENKQKSGYTYALCIGVPDWETKGSRMYEMIGSNSDNSCFLSGYWNKSTTSNAYVTPYKNCAVSLEFTNLSQANEVKALLDKAVAEAKK